MASGLYRATQSTRQMAQRCKRTVKGRVAEVLVENLFEHIGFEVHRYGVEYSLPTILRDLMKFRGHPLVDEIRSLPDFVITRSGRESAPEVYEIEVKYRESGTFAMADIASKFPEYRHIQTLFVIVSPKSVEAISYSDLTSGMMVGGKERCFLGDRPEFAADRDRISYFCGFIRNVYSEGLVKNA